MGMLTPNPVIGFLNGKVGDLVFVHTKDGRIRVQHRPVRRAGFSAGELKGQALLAAANRYVHDVRQDPERYADYQNAARVIGKRACDLAKADFIHPPAVRDVDFSAYSGQAGQPIVIEATDDFGVVEVLVSLNEIAGGAIEEGAASLDQASGRWIYKAQMAVRPGQTIVVQVSAVDRPGNVATKSVDHALQ